MVEGLNSYDNDSPHPLLNNVVVGNLFTFVDFETLDECRNVCALWRKLAETPWCNKCPVIQIRQNNKTSNMIDIISQQHTNGADEWAAIRFTKFKLSRFNFASNWLLDCKLWETHGKQITMLELDDCNISSPTAFQDLLLCKATPVLQTLKLTRVTFSYMPSRYVWENDFGVKAANTLLQKLEIAYHNQYDILPVPWQWALECLPHLQSLTLSNFAVQRYSMLCELSRLFNGIRCVRQKHGHVHSIKRFCIHDRPAYFPAQAFPDAMLDYFRENSRIGNAHFDITPQTLGFFVDHLIDVNKCSELLSYHQNYLTRLKISSKYVPLRKSERVEQCIQLPPMERLVRLDLQDYCPTTFKFLFACRHLEQLNILVSSDYEGRRVMCNPIRDERTGWGVEEKSNLVLQSLKSFHCNARIAWNEADMLEVGKWFPNLQSLLYVPNHSSFKGICQAFPQLKRLFLFDSKLTDATFTGLTGSSKAPAAVLDTTRRPNTTNFKSLEVLGLHSFISAIGRPGSKLSNLSVTNCLLKMPYLKKFYITKFGLTPLGLIALHEAKFEVEICSAEQNASDFLVSYVMTPF